MKNLRELFSDFNFDVDEDLFMKYLKMQKLLLVIKARFWINLTVHLKKWEK